MTVRLDSVHAGVCFDDDSGPFWRRGWTHDVTSTLRRCIDLPHRATAFALRNVVSLFFAPSRDLGTSSRAC